MKNNQEHFCPIGPITKSILQNYPYGQSYNSWSEPLRKLRKRTGIPDFTLHDARRFYSTAHAQLRTPIDIQEALLAHVTGSRSQLQRIYDRYERREPMKNAQLAYESYLGGLLGLLPSPTCTEPG